MKVLLLASKLQQQLPVLRKNSKRPTGPVLASVEDSIQSLSASHPQADMYIYSSRTAKKDIVRQARETKKQRHRAYGGVGFFRRSRNGTCGPSWAGISVLLRFGVPLPGTKTGKSSRAVSRSISLNVRFLPIRGLPKLDLFDFGREPYVPPESSSSSSSSNSWFVRPPPPVDDRPFFMCKTPPASFFRVQNPLCCGFPSNTVGCVVITALIVLFHVLVPVLIQQFSMCVTKRKES